MMRNDRPSCRVSSAVDEFPCPTPINVLRHHAPSASSSKAYSKPAGLAKRKEEGREKCQDCRPAPLPLTPRPCEAAGEATGAKARALRCPSHYRTGKDRGMLWSTKDSERFAGPRLSPPRGEVLGGSLTRM